MFKTPKSIIAVMDILLGHANAMADNLLRGGFLDKIGGKTSALNSQTFMPYASSEHKD